MGPGAIALELAALDEENFNVHVTGLEDEDLARIARPIGSGGRAHGRECGSGTGADPSYGSRRPMWQTSGTVRRFHLRRGIARLVAGEKPFLMVTGWATAYWDDPN